MGGGGLGDSQRTLRKRQTGSVADPVGSEPFWSDPDLINCPDPDLTIKSHKQERNLIRNR